MKRILQISSKHLTRFNRHKGLNFISSERTVAGLHGSCRIRRVNTLI